MQTEVLDNLVLFAEKKQIKRTKPKHFKMTHVYLYLFPPKQIQGLDFFPSKISRTYGNLFKTIFEQWQRLGTPPHAGI